MRQLHPDLATAEKSMTALTIGKWLNFDALALFMVGLVAFIALVVGAFAWRYMAGDSARGRFFLRLFLLVAALVLLVAADHFLLLLAAWALSNLLLVGLMVHKPGWRAARAAGALAGRNFLLGFGLITAALLLIHIETGISSIRELNDTGADGAVLHAALLLLMLGAMTQSALWPFHRWLLSSLNAPTPVSALMHAGLVNGGGFLLVRFSPVYLEAPQLLTLLFAVAMASALVGTLWKLMQHDVKRMLASSTMAQMGFMLAQCGLGLFPAAIAHMCWHGLFKASLFLASGGAARERRSEREGPPRAVSLLLALGSGALASFLFAAASGKSWLAADTTLVLVTVAFIGASQVALTLLRQQPLRMLPLAVLASGSMGLLYGGSVRLVELLIAPAVTAQPLPLGPVHIIAIALLLASWLAMLFLRRPGGQMRLPAWALRLYVAALNASRPHPATVTAQRNHYNPM